MRRLPVHMLVLGLLLGSLAVAAQEPEEFYRPDFEMPDLDGRMRSIAEWDGKAVMINFWATWCIPCKREIPLLNELAGTYADRDFEVLGIAVDSPEKVREYLQSMPMRYTTLVEEEASQVLATQLTGSFLVLPFTVFLDHQGRILWMQVEEIHRDEALAVLERIWQIRAGELGFNEAQLALIEAFEGQQADH